MTVEIRDDFLPDPTRYRQYALSRPFADIRTSAQELWRGIAMLPVVGQPVPELIRGAWPLARPHLTFFRKSPQGQLEPNFVHSDYTMGAWTAILYLNPDPPEGDGTDFWRYRSGTTAGDASRCSKDKKDWTRWQHVAAKFNRLLIFDGLLFHSRAIEDNYGQGDDARLIQVTFGNWAPC